MSTQHQKSHPRNDFVKKVKNPCAKFKNILTMFQEMAEKPININFSSISPKNLQEKNEIENENNSERLSNQEVKNFTAKINQIGETKPRSLTKLKKAQPASRNPPSKIKSNFKANSTLSPARTTTNHTNMNKGGLDRQVKSSKLKPITAFFKPQNDATTPPSKSETQLVKLSPRITKRSSVSCSLPC